MPKDEQPGISEETAAMLDDHVKKGKARKFFLIYKGASIKTLVVFKKGPFGPKIMKAKKDGFKGEVVTGIITGKGKNLLFQLPGNPDVADAMKAEGSCEKEPTKKAKLKEFLANNGLKRKPEYEIITDVGAVLDPESDEEAVVPGLEAIEAEDNDADASGPTEETAPGADEELGRKLAEAVKKVKPLMVAAIKADPTKKEEIQSTIVSISGQIKAKEYDQAKQDVKAFVAMLKELTAGASAPPPPPGPPPPPPGGANAKKSEWDWRSKELAPKLKQVLSEKLEDFQAIAALFKEAKNVLDEDAAEAVEKLKQCATMVDAALNPAAETAAATEPTAEQYAEAWRGMSAGFATQRQLVASATPDALKAFDDLVDEARALAAQGDYKGAIALAGKAADLHMAATRAGVAAEQAELIPEGIVEQRKKFVQSRWQEALRVSHAQVDKLQSQIEKSVPAEDAAELVGGINVALDELCEEINDAILGTQSASPSDLSPINAAIESIGKFKAKLANDPLIQHLDKAKVQLGLEINAGQTLIAALDEVEQQLAL